MALMGSQLEQLAGVDQRGLALSGPGLKHAGQDGADLGRGVELAGALAAALGEPVDRVL
jgi:hypothetical protein